MEARGRREKRKQKEKKRKRISSGTISASEMSSDTLDESIVVSSAETTDAPDTVMDENILWNFIRENSGAIVQKIVMTNEWRDNVQAYEDNSKALEEENKELRHRLAIAEGTILRCEKAIRRLEDKVTDITTRSMRENILIKNIEEPQNEREFDVEEKVLSTLKTELQIPDSEMEKITVERAHRIGKPTRDRARHIVAKLNCKGKRITMKHLKNLNKSSKVKITEQFPPEVHANREKLWPIFIEAKQRGKATRWSADKLQVDGRTINPPKDSNKDINLDVTEEAMKLEVKHTALTSKNNNHFQAHTVDIQSVDQVIPAVKAMCSDSTIAGASHVAYAYRVGTESHSISNWDDDGEWGAGKKIMECIRNNNSYNILVCVTRWHGSQTLGPVRFEIIKDLSNTAITQSGFP